MVHPCRVGIQYISSCVMALSKLATDMFLKTYEVPIMVGQQHLLGCFDYFSVTGDFNSYNSYQFRS